MSADNSGSARGAALRIFERLAGVWALTEPEQLRLLGLRTPAQLASIRQKTVAELPEQTVERFAILLDIFRSINTLLPVHASADTWVRAPNKGVIFAGRSALELMLEQDLQGMHMVQIYLRSQLAGP